MFHNFWQISLVPECQRRAISDHVRLVLVLKDEPDDLTHLAPTAGDSCIQLDESAPFFSDMFDDFIIPDNYNALLTDELNSLDSSCSKTTSSSSSSNDPFINYRDDSNDICHSPHLLSPGLSKVRWRRRSMTLFCPTQTNPELIKNWKIINSSVEWEKGKANKIYKTKIFPALRNFVEFSRHFLFFHAK